MLHQFMKKISKKTIGQLAFYQFSQKYLTKVSLHMSDYFEDVFNKQQSGFCKSYNTQRCLLKMMKKWKSPLNKGKIFGALLTDLCTVLDCLDHEFFILKLNAYDFSFPTITLIYDNLSIRKQRTRIGNLYRKQ